MGWYSYRNTTGNPYVRGVASGYKVARGVVTLDGANPTPVATGLAAVVSGTANLISTAMTTGDIAMITVQFTTTTGNLDIYAWKNTSTAVTNLIASTTTGFTVAWIASGV